MKQYTLKDGTQFFLLETTQDFQEYETELQKKWRADVKLVLIQNKLNQSHTRYGTAIFHAASSLVKVLGGNIIHRATKLRNDMLADMRHKLNQKMPIRVNLVDGWNIAGKPDEEEIDYVEEFNPLTERIIHRNSNFLVLENDQILDSWIKSYFAINPPNQILDLRYFTEIEIEEHMHKFVAKGSEHLFVYTTGIDFEQMVCYVDSAYNAGFRSFVFVFPTQPSKKVVDFLENLRKACVVQSWNRNNEVN